MIINLFSIFDPSTSNYLSLNWISIFPIFFVLPSWYWVNPSRYQIFWKTIIQKILEEVKNNLNLKNQKFIIIFICIFSSILIFNSLGLLPYIFTPSRHIVLSIIIAFPIWLTLILKGWINSFNKIITHLVPIGAPLILTSFIVVIETVRNIIRPITLSIRLSANIIRGHLLIHLLTSIPHSSPIIIYPIFPVILILLILETAVAIIQRYVFITLSSLYTNEI